MIPITVSEQEKILSFLESKLDAKVYGTWCRKLKFETVGENSVLVPPANPFYRDWLEKLLRKPLEDAFQSLFGRVPEIVFQVSGEPPVTFSTPVSAAPTAVPPAPPPEPDFVFN